MKKKLLFVSLLVLGATLSGVQFFNTRPVDAADLSKFQPGRIIDDAVFTDGTSMTASQVQDFLNYKNSTCLKDFKTLSLTDDNGDGVVQDSTTEPYGPDLVSAAEVIAQASKIYRISPKVILATLQKEQGLITRTDCPDWRYNTALGYGCPDTAPCDQSAFGFTRQIDFGTYHFRGYFDDSLPSVPYGTGNQQIFWHPDTGRCGSSTVNVVNRSTASLYNYTPYRPNQASLDAGYGEGDSCSSYGNRNFFSYFTDWFGGTQESFTQLLTPRWMESAVSTVKRNPWTNTAQGDTLTAGTQLRFVDKILVNNTWYLRTESDRNNNEPWGIPQGDLKEIEPMPFQTARYMQLNSDRKKWNPVTGKVEPTVYPTGTTFMFKDKILVNGNYFFRVEADTDNNLPHYITASGVDELRYISFDTPRWMQIKSSATKVDPATGASQQTLEANSNLYFSSKTKIGNTAYYRTKEDTDANNTFAVAASSVQEIPYQLIGSAPKWMLLTRDTPRYHPATEASVPKSDVRQGMQILLSQSIAVNNRVYYRTLYNQERGQDYAIPAEYFIEVPYVPLDNPRIMEVSKATQYKIPATGEDTTGALAIGDRHKFTTKTYINGVLYLRSDQDTADSVQRGILFSALKEAD